MTGKPLWRQAVESLDERVSGHLEQVVHSENFGVAVGLLLRARRECGAVTSGVTTALLHAVNLPAKRDFDRVLKHLASLEREVLALTDGAGGPGSPGAQAGAGSPGSEESGGTDETRAP